MILFAWRRLPPPGFIGGAEISEGLLARSLAAAGEEVVFVGSTTNPRDPTESWLSWLLRLLNHDGIPYEATRARTAIAYSWRGVDCLAVGQDVLLATVRRLAARARLIWTCQEDSPRIRATAARLPAVSYAHSVSDVGLLSAQVGARWVLAPSRFVQNVIRDRFELDAHLLRPPLEPPHEPPRSRRDLILFVNPIRDKGVELAVELARQLSTDRFAFVEAWRPADSDLSLSPNVQLMPRVPSLAPLYQRAKLLIVPSRIDDACPRVILEAGSYGIPAVGSERGGIPELVADPSNVLPADDLKAWHGRCQALLESPGAWQEASAAQLALANSMHTDPIARLREIGLPIAAAAAAG